MVRIRVEADPGELEDRRDEIADALLELSKSVRAGQLPTAPEEDLTKSQRSWEGLTLNIENEKGSIRYWGDPEAGEQTLMHFQYGEILGTKGADGDPYDVYLGPDPDGAPYVYVIHQRDPKTNEYDEDKAMIGFPTPHAAYLAYIEHYDSADFFESMSAMRKEEFAHKVRTTEDGCVKGGETVTATDPLVKGPATGRATGGRFEEGSNLYTHMGGRAVHSGSGVNIAFNSPAGPSANIPVDPGHKAMAEERANRKVHNQRKLYREEIQQLQTPQELPLVPVKLPKDKIDADADVRSDAKDRRKYLDRYTAARFDRTQSAPVRLHDPDVRAKFYIPVAPQSKDEDDRNDGRTGPT